MQSTVVYYTTRIKSNTKCATISVLKGVMQKGIVLYSSRSDKKLRKLLKPGGKQHIDLVVPKYFAIIRKEQLNKSLLHCFISMGRRRVKSSRRDFIIPYC